jgi:hypothetical protein
MRNHPTSFGVNALVRRGWTLELIERVLGAEDQLAPNAQYPGRTDRPMRLYSRARVEAAELGADFIRCLERRDRRSPRTHTTSTRSETQRAGFLARLAEFT